MASQIRDKRDKRIPLYVKGWVCKILKETRQLRRPIWQCVSYSVPCQEDLFWNGGTRWQQTRRKTFTAPRRFLRTTRRVGKPNCLYFTASIAFIYIISVSRLSVWLVKGVTFPLPYVWHWQWAPAVPCDPAYIMEQVLKMVGFVDVTLLPI